MVYDDHGGVVETTLTTCTISSVERTSSYFSDQRVFDNLVPGEQPVILTINRAHLWASIPAGVYVLVSNWGVINPKPATPGLMFLPFWRHIECVITSNFIPVDVPIKLCPTLDNVLIQVDVIILIHIEDPYKFYVNVGPYKLQRIVASFVEEAIRSLARTLTYYEAYDIRGMGIEDMVRTLNEKLEQFGVICADITVTDIYLPEDLKTSMAEKTGYASSMKAHNREHEFNEKKIEYEEIRTLENLKHNNQRFAYDTEMKKLMNMIQKETSEIESLAQKSCSEIQSKQTAEALVISSKAKLEAAKLEGKKIRDYQITIAKGKQESNVIKANEIKYNEIKRSEITLNVSDSKAKALTKISEAEQKSKDKLKAKREDIIKRAQLSVLNSLSENPNLVISGSSSDDKLSQLVASGMKPNALMMKQIQ
eukprot:gene3246-5689_t